MRFCGACGSPLGDAQAVPGGANGHAAAQRRHMTAMFCDIVDSTPLAESLDAEDFREVLRAYRHACVRAVQRFDGYTADYVGDGVVAFFGYPRAHEDDAHRAVHAALAVLDELAALNSQLGEAYNIALRVRIGLHTGVVVAGETDSDDPRSQVDVVGPMPHIASRLQTVAPPDSVVISDATHDLVDGWFETETLGEKELKGVSRPLVVHRVVRSTGAVGRLDAATARRLTPVVGREEELARLAESLEAARAGHGTVVHVRGEAGIGKSRLVHALAERRRTATGTEQTWQCSPHHRNSALYPVVRLLESLPGIDRGTPAEDQLAALAEAVAAAGLEPLQAVPLLADLLSIPGDREPAAGLTPLDARTALLRTLEALLVSDPARHPLRLVVEDVHWADPTTIELLGRIVAGLRDLPVLCVMTFRPEFRPPWTPAHPVVEIDLGRLSAAEVRAMATAASDTALEPDVLEWVEAAADGVPLFVEEMVKMLGREGGSGIAGGRDETAVPPTLEGLLTERLDRLPDLGGVIDVAAVLGREFDRSLLGALEPLAADDLEPALVQLAAQDVLRPVGGTPARYEFSHALLQEAAYERILRRRRRLLHSRVADTLVRRFGDVAEREPELVAYHWTCAAEPAGAMPYWRAAGTRALERAAYLEAAEHFRRGLEALEARGAQPGDEHVRVDLLTHQAASLQAGRGYAAAGVEDAYARARAACERTRDGDRLVSVIRGQWMFHLLRGQYATALELGEEMLALGERDDHPVRLGEGQLYRGLVHMYLGNFERARDLLGEAYRRYRRPERSDQIYEAQGDTGVGAVAYLALVLWNLGYADESRARSDLSLERAERVGGPVTRAQAWGMRSILHLSCGEPAELSRWVQRTHAHSVDHDLGYWRTVSALLGGWLEGRAGELARGTARVEQSLDAYLAAGNRLSLPHFHILLADLRLAAGDRRGALDLLDAGEEHIAQTGERFSESELFRFRARALMTGDDPDPAAATAAYERSIAVAREQNARLLELRAASRLAAHETAPAEGLSAIDRVAALCDWFGPSADLPDVVRARGLVKSAR